MRKPTIEESLGQKSLKPTEKLRWRKHEQIVVDYGSKHEKRIKELAERSKEINKLLQKKLDQANLPYSTKKTHSKVLRFSIRLNPEFVQSSEEKEGKRFKGSDDEVVFFIHLKEDNSYDTTRWYTAMKGAYPMYFTGRLIEPNDEEDLENLDYTNNEQIAEFITQKLEENHYTKLFSKASQFQDLEQAELFFDNQSLFLYQDPAIIRNLTKIGLKAILEAKLRELADQKIPQIREELQTLAEQFLKINIKKFSGGGTKKFEIKKFIGYGKKGEQEQVVKTIIHSLIKDVLDEYKRSLYK